MFMRPKTKDEIFDLLKVNNKSFTIHLKLIIELYARGNIKWNELIKNILEELKKIV